MTSAATESRRTGYRPVPNWGQPPSGSFDRDVPGVAVGPDDEVYVFTRGGDGMTVYAKDGTFLRGWGSGQFTNPHAVRVAPDGFVWCVDYGDQTVRKFSPTGEPLLTLGSPGVRSDTGTEFRPGNGGTASFLEITHSAGPFNGPTDVAVLTDGTVFVSDGYGNARVHRFSVDGRLWTSWGAPGVEPGQFNLPHSIIVTPDEQRLLVADRENNRIQVFDLEGNLLAVWSGWCRPTGLAITSEALLCVVELGLRVGRWPHMGPAERNSQSSRCVLADLDGNRITSWGTDDPTQVGSFYAAHAVAVDSANAVYVAAPGVSLGNGSHTLQKFERHGQDPRVPS